MKYLFLTLFLMFVCGCETGTYVNVTKILPSTTIMLVGTKQVLKIQITGTNLPVDWSIQEPNGGTITKTEKFAVTYTAPGLPGVYHVIIKTLGTTKDTVAIRVCGVPPSPPNLQ